MVAPPHRSPCGPRRPRQPRLHAHLHTDAPSRAGHGAAGAPGRRLCGGGRVLRPGRGARHRGGAAEPGRRRRTARRSSPAPPEFLEHTLDRVGHRVWYADLREAPPPPAPGWTWSGPSGRSARTTRRGGPGQPAEVGGPGGASAGDHPERPSPTPCARRDLTGAGRLLRPGERRTPGRPSPAHGGAGRPTRRPAPAEGDRGRRPAGRHRAGGARRTGLPGAPAPYVPVSG